MKPVTALTILLNLLALSLLGGCKSSEQRQQERTMLSNQMKSAVAPFVSACERYLFDGASSEQLSKELLAQGFQKTLPIGWLLGSSIGRIASTKDALGMPESTSAIHVNFSSKNHDCIIATGGVSVYITHVDIGSELLATGYAKPQALDGWPQKKGIRFVKDERKILMTGKMVRHQGTTSYTMNLARVR